MSGGSWVGVLLLCSGVGIESELDKGETETDSGAIFCSVGCVEQICEEEANKLEKIRDEDVEDKDKDGTGGQIVDEDAGRVCGGVHDCLPVRRDGICVGILIRWQIVAHCVLWHEISVSVLCDCRTLRLRFCHDICKDAVIFYAAAEGMRIRGRDS